MAGKTYSTDWKSRKASEKAIADFENKFVKDMGVTLNRSDLVTPYEVIPTGSLTLDQALKIGGFPLGRVVELWGPEHAGKTSLAVLTAAQAQKTYPDKMVAWVDMEQTFDRAWAVKLGLDLNRIWLPPPPKTAEDVGDMTKRFVESGLCSLVVLDSVGGMIAKIEFEKEADEATVGNVAKIVTRMVKQCSPIGHANGTTTMVINQVRSNIARYGADTTTSGGWALKHITTMKLKVQRGGSRPKMVRHHGADIPVGYEVTVKVEKNKCAPYGSVASLWLFNQETAKYGPVGVDRAAEAAEFALDLGIITGTGWYTLPDATRLQGKEAVIEELRTRPELISEIRDAVLSTVAEQIHTEDPALDEGDEEDNDPMGISTL